MRKLKTAIFYLKLNLLWLFRYRCRIPNDVWVADGKINKGSLVFIVNKRLHIVRQLDSGKQQLAGLWYGISICDGNMSKVEMLTSGNIETVYYDNTSEISK